jgi:parallel beta-helix repeat protein
VVGNYIGTNETGTEARPNQFYGVFVGSNGSQSNQIGGSVPEDRNVISGNGSHGVSLNFPTFDNRVVGNFIGTTVSGTEALPNGGNGVFLSGVRENIVGGTTAGSRNLISGNGRNGVSIEGGINNQVAGNYIGTDVTGAVTLPNGHNGVIVSNNADAMLIGGVGALARNVISGNMLHGVEVTSSSVSINLQGNFIGTDQSGLVALGNGGSGIMINSTGNQVGGFISQARNVISSNGGDGIVVGRGSARNVIVGNLVGVAVTSQEVLPNGGNGLLLVDTTDNTVGGLTPASGNVIGCNLGNGISLLRATSNQIVGNFIGSDASGSVRLGNYNDGIRFQDSVGNRIDANTITYSARAGISILGSSSHNRISRNAIFDNGTLGIDLNGDGVSQNDSSDLDAGPNELRNFPIITSVTAMGEGLMIRGFLPSLMPNLQTIELFRAKPDASGYGEGSQYLERATPDADGNFTILMQGVPSESPLTTALSNGDQLTATATDLQGNTSEFSPNFTIGIGDTLAPQVVVLSPNGGESIDAGETMTIRWRSFDNIGIVAQDVLLSTDGGQNFRPLRTNLAGVIQELQVQVPIVIDTAQAVICIVVRDGNGNQARDCSDDHFVIFGRDVFPPTVTLMSPNGGEIIAAGQPYTITWQASDDRPGVSCSVLLSVDGGSTYNTLASGLMGAQSYTWQVPAVLGATRARIRVVCRDGAGMTSQDESDATFAIDRSAPEVRVSSPNGGDLIVRLSIPVRIQWSSSDDVAVAAHDILISTDGGETFTPVVTNLPGPAQSYDWVLPRGLRTSRARIRIVTRDFVGRTAQDDSDRNFVLIRL